MPALGDVGLRTRTTSEQNFDVGAAQNSPFARKARKLKTRPKPRLQEPDRPGCAPDRGLQPLALDLAQLDDGIRAALLASVGSPPASPPTTAAEERVRVRSR